MCETYVLDDYLPTLQKRENKIVNGRSPYEGYQRGWGLQFAKKTHRLVEKILSDKAYQLALSAAQGLTVVSQPNRMNMFLIMKHFVSKLDEGDFIEFGSYKGGNAIFLAVLAKLFGHKGTVYACDSFEGMPEVNTELDLHSKGNFSDANFEFLERYVQDLGLDNLVLVKGFFEDTLLQPEMKELKFRLAHIDCDIEPACETSYSYQKNKMVSMGYIVFDDATVSSCIGATSFVEETLIRSEGKYSEQIWPHYVFRAQH